MHASISTHIAAGFYDKFAAVWKINSDLYWKRVGDYPERILNLFFLYSMELKALAKIGNYLINVYRFETGHPDDNESIKVSFFNFLEFNC